MTPLSPMVRTDKALGSLPGLDRRLCGREWPSCLFHLRILHEWEHDSNRQHDRAGASRDGPAFRAGDRVLGGGVFCWDLAGPFGAASVARVSVRWVAALLAATIRVMQPGSLDAMVCIMTLSLAMGMMNTTLSRVGSELQAMDPAASHPDPADAGAAQPCRSRTLA
jgi:hypothetical protein